MSRHEYIESEKLAAADPPFYALIMAAMRRADTTNATVLRLAFPFVWIELQERYDAPGGWLPSERAEQVAE